MLKTFHKAGAFTFAMGEHACAVSYALGDAVKLHTELLLTVFSLILLGALVWVMVCKCVERCRGLHYSYRSH